MKKLILTILTLLSVTCYSQTVIEPQMVLVQGGTFSMGSNENDSEKPIHSVTLSSYYIGKYEVTQKEWTAIMGENPSNFKGDDLPVENVSFDDCQKFIKRLNAKTKKKYRLPTEAEWEFAARGGNKSNGYKYSGSNSLDDVAWFEGNSGNETSSVGQKQANELGLYDMSGNVWEWCNDYHGKYGSNSQTNPKGAESVSYRVFRGGSWYYDADYCRVAFRSYYSSGFRSNYLGFRLVCPF